MDLDVSDAYKNKNIYISDLIFYYIIVMSMF